MMLGGCEQSVAIQRALPPEIPKGITSIVHATPYKSFLACPGKGLVSDCLRHSPAGRSFDRKGGPNSELQSPTLHTPACPKNLLQSRSPLKRCTRSLWQVLPACSSLPADHAPHVRLKAFQRCHALNIQIVNSQGVALDKLAARLNPVTHKLHKSVGSLVGVFH